MSFTYDLFWGPQKCHKNEEKRRKWLFYWWQIFPSQDYRHLSHQFTCNKVQNWWNADDNNIVPIREWHLSEKKEHFVLCFHDEGVKQHQSSHYKALPIESCRTTKVFTETSCWWRPLCGGELLCAVENWRPPHPHSSKILRRLHNLAVNLGSCVLCRGGGRPLFSQRRHFDHSDETLRNFAYFLGVLRGSSTSLVRSRKELLIAQEEERGL